jgi:soluble lytic murein transglycosylase
MPHNAVNTLVCVALLGLSCALTPPRAERLPAVSAPAPAPVAAPVAVAAAKPETVAPDARITAAMAAHLGSRQQTGMTESEIAAVARAIALESRRHGIDPALVLAVIHVESRYDAFAVSSVGAMGLMQILPPTGEELAAREGVDWRGPQTLFDPVVNVRLGVAYLKELTDRYGSTSLALAAYNWGPGHIDRRLHRGVPLPTVYPALVLEAYSANRARRS